LVKELLKADGTGWDHDKMNECFFEVDIADILKIPVGRLDQTITSLGITPRMESSV
jgi:hypothetical protein